MSYFFRNPNQYSPKYFTIGELTESNTAKKYNIPNVPNQEQLTNMLHLIQYVLDPLRVSLGCPVYVSSGYRSPELNKKVGGSKTSQHCKGQAADLYLKGKSNIAIAKALLDIPNWDQLIIERGSVNNPQWIHISWSSNPRRQILYYNGKKYLPITEHQIKNF